MTHTLIDPQRLHELYDHHVTAEIQRALVMGVAEGYRVTWESCAVFEDEVRVQAWRYSRWNGIDSAILQVGRRFKGDGVQADYVANTCETDVCHAQLTIGPLLITAHAVQDIEELPRSAAYRDLLAESNQETLFGPPRKKPEKLWVPLLHIPNPERKLPSAVFVAFPDGAGGTAAEPLHLLKRYPIDNDGAEKITDMAEPTRRIQSEKGS